MKLKKTVGIILLSVLFAANLSAQQYTDKFKDERRIFLFDVTLSMCGVGGNPNIMAQVIDELENSINAISKESTEIIVIPFTDKVLDVWNEYATPQGKSNIVKKLNNTDFCKGTATNTNIYAPLKSVFDNYISPEKRNVLMVLTDGKHNVKNPSLNDLINLIKSCCPILKENDTYAFYVRLTEAAQNDNEFFETLRENCFEVIDVGDVITLPIELFFQSPIKFNVQDDNNHNVAINLIRGDSIPLPHDLELKITSEENDYITVNSVNKIVNDKLFFDLDFNQSLLDLQTTLPENENEKIELYLEVQREQNNNPQVILLEKTITLELINRPERTLKLDIEGQTSNIYFGKTDYYPNFLFKKYQPIIMSKTLNSDFNQIAANSVQNVEFALYEKNSNGKFSPINDGDIILYKNQTKCVGNKFSLNGNEKSSDIGIEFTKRAQKGNHTLYLKVEDAAGLTRINEDEIADNEQPIIISITAKKKNVMNPLLIILLWIAAILIAAILIWLIFLKRQFYPRFRVKFFIIQSPYYASKTLTSCYKFVLSNKKIKQNGFSRMFKGKVAYDINPVWTTPLVFEPRDRNSIRMCKSADYSIEPITATLQKGIDYTITNNTTNETITVNIN